MGITIYKTPKVYKMKEGVHMPLKPAIITIVGECEILAGWTEQIPQQKKWLIAEDLTVMYSEDFIHDKYTL